MAPQKALRWGAATSLASIWRHKPEKSEDTQCRMATALQGPLLVPVLIVPFLAVHFELNRMRVIPAWIIHKANSPCISCWDKGWICADSDENIVGLGKFAIRYSAVFIRGIAETRQFVKIQWPQSSWGCLWHGRQSHSSQSHYKAKGVHSGTGHQGDVSAFTGHAEQLHWLHFQEKCAGDGREAQWFHLHHIWQQSFRGWPGRVFLLWAVWTGKGICSLPCFLG